MSAHLDILLRQTQAEKCHAANELVPQIRQRKQAAPQHDRRHLHKHTDVQVREAPASAGGRGEPCGAQQTLTWRIEGSACMVYPTRSSHTLPFVQWSGMTNGTHCSDITKTGSAPMRSRAGVSEKDLAWRQTKNSHHERTVEDVTMQHTPSVSPHTHTPSTTRQ